MALAAVSAPHVAAILAIGESSKLDRKRVKLFKSQYRRSIAAHDQCKHSFETFHQ